MTTRSVIAGCGGYLPERIVRNDDLGREFGRQMILPADSVEAVGQRARPILDRFHDFTIVTWATSIPRPRKPPSQYIK